MKNITLFLACLLLLTSCADTVATPEVSYRTRFTIKNSSQSDLAFHWNGMDDEILHTALESVSYLFERRFRRNENYGDMVKVIVLSYSLKYFEAVE